MVISMSESFRPSLYPALVTSSNLGKLQGLSHSSRQTPGGGGASPTCDSVTLGSKRVQVRALTGRLGMWYEGVGCFFSLQ